MELHIAPLEDAEYNKLRYWFKEKFGVQSRRLGEEEGTGFLITFPEGSTEEPNPKADPRHREETIITIPAGAKFLKVVRWPCTRESCTHTFLFPLKEEEKEEKRYIEKNTTRMFLKEEGILWANSRV